MALSFDDLIAAPVMGKGKRLQPTTESTLILERIRAKKGFKGYTFVLEFYVSATKDPNADPVGSRVAEVYTFNADETKNKTKMSLVKTILVALGLDAADMRKVLTDADRGTGELARGMSVKVTAWKGEGGDFIQKNWVAVKHPDPVAAMQAGRAILDAAPSEPVEKDDAAF